MAGASDEVIDQLRRAVTVDRDQDPSWAGAIRLRTRLQPAGGPGTKVMPPTYAAERPGGPPVYVEEMRIVEGEQKDCVSLDSVASQANRAELALADEIALGNEQVPTIWVDQGKFGTHSALEFSHRAFDSWIEDAVLDGTRFGESELWSRLAGSKRHDLSALMSHSPASILLGSWASRLKNPQGAARLARILTSEILAVGAEKGARAKGKRDVHDVSAAIEVYEAGEDSPERIVLDSEQAAKDKKGKPVLFGGEKKKGKPSAAGYGAVTPSLADHGGITMEYALQIATISLPAIRECRFPNDGERDPERDVAARLMLTTLGLRLLALQVERGYDLRSGCLLVPEEEPAFELLDRLGKTVKSWPVMKTDTAALLEIAKAGGAERGVDWVGGDIHLDASPAQLELLERSLVEPADDGE
jgi:CRISPR-associated protein Csb1